MRSYLFLLLFIAGWLGLAIAIPAAAQTAAQSATESNPQNASPNWRGQRMALERKFGDELQGIANWCRENGIEQQVDQTLKLYRNRDPQRQYIFFPTEKSMPTRKADVLGQWLTKVNAAKVTHAGRILELAEQASEQGAGAIAFQLLHEVIYYDRDRADVRKMLGHAKADDGWKVASDSLRVKPGSKPHDLISWPAGSYIRVLTPHFEIESNASEERTSYLAEQLERAHHVWRQVFFEYWSSPAAVERWIQGKGAARIAKQRFRVVFFNDRESYLRQLQPLVKGIEVSTGYYSSDQQVSFFYDGDDRVRDTWRHELTHQLFRESGRAKKLAFEEQFIWLDEGIATYFESLTDYGDYVTLGGFDARRIQFARIRRLLENFHVPMEELSAIGRADLQQRPDMVRIYSEAAGLTDMLMNDQNGAYEQRLTEFLKLIYKGRVKPGVFEKIIGKSYQSLDERYEQYLQVDSDVVEKFLAIPESRTELSVSGANLQMGAFEAIGKCGGLTWLDLSKNSVTTEHFAKLKSCQQINQLILTECRFDKNSLRGLELFGKLDDVDLSGSSVQDYQLVGFDRLPKLTSLRLTATAITDKGLEHLADVETLRTLDVARTRVTDRGIAKLKAKLPNLTVTR